MIVDTERQGTLTPYEAGALAMRRACAARGVPLAIDDPSTLGRIIRLMRGSVSPGRGQTPSAPARRDG